MNQRAMVDPRFFLFSFIAIVVHYAALFAGLLFAMILIARVAYPRVFELWNLPREQRQPFYDAWQNSPQILFPPGLCWGLIGAGFLMALMLGISTAWWAPFSKAGHGLFLAMVCIVSFLQIAMTEPQIPKWLMMGLLVFCSLGIVVGSRYGERWFFVAGDQDDGDDDELPDNHE
jgi:hypothetical protein